MISLSEPVKVDGSGNGQYKPPHLATGGVVDADEQDPFHGLTASIVAESA